MSEQERSLKVIRVIDRLVYGGPTRNVVLLTEGLANRGFECKLITGVPAEGEGDMTFWAQEYGVEPISLPEMSRELAFRDIVVIWRLLQLFRDLGPDIVHTHKSKAGAAGRVASFLYKWCSPSIWRLKPRKLCVVHTFHGHIFHSYYGKLKTSMFVAIERLLACVTDCIVTVSEQQVTEIRDVFGVGRKTTFRVVPLAMDFRPPSDPNRFREENCINPEDVLVGAVGRLCEVKNFGLMLKALAYALKARPEFRIKLALVGDGHLRPELEKCAREYNLESKIFFTGFRSDLEDIYPALDLAALSSLNEGTPLTLIEAMSHGRPVLTTEVGGFQDVLGNLDRSSGRFTIWENGISVPSGDVEAYAEALIYLVSNRVHREQMGARARIYVWDRYSKERLMQNMASLYSELWGGNLTSHAVPDFNNARKAAAR